jgi:UDP-N-acetylmuramoyl-L-alanyl-D-glutamate--2,6-diaminopimelate ligase
VSIKLINLLKATSEYKNNHDFLLKYKDIIVNNLKLDSREVKPGDLFLAYQGRNQDGRDYINQAVENGATCVFYEQSGDADSLHIGLQSLALSSKHSSALLIPVVNLNKILSDIAAEFYNNPSIDQNIYAFTGTNGKSTCSYLLAQLIYYLNDYKLDVGLIGTIGYGAVSKIIQQGLFNKSNVTTPDPVLLQKILLDFKLLGINNISIEASSHALDQYRLSGVNINTAIFTNLTHDHLDYHKTIEQYYLAKKKLFYFPSVKNIVINIDDAYGRKLLLDLLADNITEQKNIIIYGFEQLNLAQYESYNLPYVWYQKDSLILTITDKNKNYSSSFNIKYNLIGNFNIYNLLAVVASLYLNNYNMTKLPEAISKLVAAPGRMESFYCAIRKVMLVVDYAHTPDALKQTLIALREHANQQDNKNSKIWCVFGCGGDRDKSKRPEMGAIAELYADKIIITDDNPRTENADSIIADVLAGINDKNKLYKIINNRREAIQQAFSMAEADDIILIAGKGHEDYQIYGAEKLDYNEREFVKGIT